MNAEKMFYNFRVQLDKFNSSISITSDDMKYYLNKAMLDYIEKKFNGMNYTRKGFQQSPQIIAELQPLYKTGVSLTPYYPNIISSDNYEIDRAELPTDLLYYISSSCKITYVGDPAHIEINTTGTNDVRQVITGNDSKDKYVSMKLVQSDDLYQLQNDPFNKSSLTKVLVDINENYLDIYTTDVAITSNIILNYIKLPLEINYEGNGSTNNQDCELPDFTHADIVELAVQMYIETQPQNAN